MSQVFPDEFGLPEPDVQLGAGSGSHAGQTARIMLGAEEALLDVAPDVVVVVGDVNSTIAAALVAAKLGIPVAHVEAGLRSFHRTMPEEVNRVLTDAIADLLFAPSVDGVETTVLGVPCGTMRTTTERPITVSEGTNHLAGTDPPTPSWRRSRGPWTPPASPTVPPLWDGATAPRIVDVLLSTFGANDPASPSKHPL